MVNRVYYVKLGGEALKYHYPTVTVMSWVEHIVSLFPMMLIKITIFKQMIGFHK